MTDILAQNLIEKGVMRNDGKDMGTLENITVDLKTGKLESIVVKPKEDIVKSDFEGYDKNSEGNFFDLTRRFRETAQSACNRCSCCCHIVNTGAVGQVCDFCSCVFKEELQLPGFRR